MKRSLITLIIIYAPLILSAQSNKAIIEGQIIGYNRESVINYSLNDSFDSNNGSIKPDSLGRFYIEKEIKGIEFFTMYYEQEGYRHTCRLILEPGKHYSFVSKGLYDPNHKSMEHYSPDIYIMKEGLDEEAILYKLDQSQMYYNLIDNGTSGYLYNDSWDLKKPDDLISTLNERIKEQLAVFDDLKSKGEINNDFYDIAKLNIEYTNAYRLAQTIIGELNWKIQAIDDTLILNNLKDIYQQIFELFPVNQDVKLEFHYCFTRYVDLYLAYFEDSKSGVFIPKIRKGAANSEPLLNSKEHLSPKAYRVYSRRTSMNYLGMLGGHSIDYANLILKEQPEMNNRTAFFIENNLLPKARDFWALESEEMPENVIILNDIDTINTFSQLLDMFDGSNLLIDCWGSWCSPCRYQLQYHDTIKAFLKEFNIKMVFIAFEYGNDRSFWENMIKGFELDGYHFISNDLFRADFEKYTGKIKNFPTYIIVNKDGKVVETEAYFPSQSKLLFNQLKLKLNL